MNVSPINKLISSGFVEKISSFRAKILFSFFLLTSLTITIVGIGFWFYHQREQLTVLTVQLNAVHLHMEHAVNAEHDLYLYDLIDSSFYQTPTSQHVVLHRQALIQMRQGLQTAAKTAENVNLSLHHELGTLLAATNHYERQFAEIVALCRLRGFKDYGLEGRMRTYAHAIESLPGGYDPARLLMLRRHEKDYIIRKDSVYARKFDDVQQRMLQPYPANSPASGQVRQLLMSYSAAFHRLVATEQLIGTTEDSGLKGEIRQLVHRMQRSFARTQQKAEEQAAVLRNRFWIAFIVLVSVAIIVSVLLSYVVAYSITRPIRSLSVHINQLVSENFEKEPSPIPPVSFDEVGALTQHFNLMAQTIYTYIQEIQDKSLILEKQNEELQTINHKLAASEESLRKLISVKDKFFSIISHDLKSPLNTMTGFLHMLKHYANTFTTQELVEFAHSMDLSVQRLAALLTNLLQWSMSQSGEIRFEPVDGSLDEIIARNVDLLRETAKQKGVSLITETEPDTRVYADPNMIDFVLRNLISNAIKFTRPDGHIRVRTEVAGTMTAISVMDDGVGISEQNIARLFRADYHFSTPGTSQEKGTGFGLLLCHDFVKRHGGTTTVQSQLNVGTSITFTLPTATHPPPVVAGMNEADHA